MFCSIKVGFIVDIANLGHLSLSSNSEKNRNNRKNRHRAPAETDHLYSEVFSDSETKNSGVLWIVPRAHSRKISEISDAPRTAAKLDFELFLRNCNSISVGFIDRASQTRFRYCKRYRQQLSDYLLYQ